MYLTFSSVKSSVHNLIKIGLKYIRFGEEETKIVNVSFEL